MTYYPRIFSAGTMLLAIFPIAPRAELVTSGGVTATYQTTSDPRVDREFTASADLVLTWSSDPGEWRLYLEAASTPKTNRVSGLLPEVNADAGSALDEDREGRVQISELSYRHPFNARQTLTAGLVDVSGYFDQSRIASDENTQFLGVSFVQNPTIEFPDYTIGLIYEHSFATGPVLRAALASTNGIADNPNLSYSQLVDVDDEDKGLFAIGSMTWKRPDWLIRAGAWTHTAPHDRLDGTGGGNKNYGAYMLAGYQAAQHAVNVRLGLSNEKLSRAAGFAGLSYRYLRPPFTVGAGAARIFLSSEEPDPALDDTMHYELFLRYAVAHGLYLTADVQRIIHSNFDATGNAHDRAVTVYGLRFTYLFE